MNQKYDAPTGREPEGQQLQRLREIERRLRQARPRGPKLDWAELQQLAASSEPVVQQPAAAVRGSRRRSYRQVAIVASSWACGAVVGALAMFLLTSGWRQGSDVADLSTQPDTQTTPESYAVDVAPPAEEEDEPRDSPVDQTAGKPAEPLAGNGAVLAMIDTFGSGHWLDWPEDGPLRAGTRLDRRTWQPSNVAEPSVAQPTAELTSEPRPDPEPGRATKGRSFEPIPQVAITRDWLLEELRREMPGSVL